MAMTVESLLWNRPNYREVLGSLGLGLSSKLADSLETKGQRIEGERWLTEKETAELIAATEPQWMPIVVVGVRTGLRVGELQGLRWGDVDLDGGRLVVERSWSDQLEDVGRATASRRGSAAGW